jgi:hypothetical protein
VVALSAVAGASACGRGAAIPFSEANAREHVEMLAGTIGSRSIGTPANDRARLYLVDQLQRHGFQVRVQETDARRPEIGRTARVRNIVAIRAGGRPEAIALVAHYDSAPESPGAADDALGVAVCVEAARVLAGRATPNHALMVVLTDGEEAGLMGAAAAAADRSIADRIAAYVNLEAIGSTGPAVLFETGPGNGWLTGVWARHAPRPRGGSFALEVYRRLPNDTDFSVFKRRELPGLNFAAIGDSYAYHTARDEPRRLSGRTLRETGASVVSIVEALDRFDLTQRSADPAMYFDIADVTALSYGPRTAAVLALGALALGLVAWIRLLGAATAAVGGWRVVFAAVWTVLAAAAGTAAMVGAAWALRAAREVYHPWYAHPDRFFALLLGCGIAAAWGTGRLGALLPRRLHVARHPAVVWAIALPVWMLLVAATSWTARDAGYLWAVPLAAAGLVLSATPPRHAAAVRVASVLVLAVAGTLWARDTAELLRFAVTVFGRLTTITPPWIYPSLILLAAIMIAPPFVAASMTERPLARPSLMTSVLLLWIAVAAGLAYAAPAYTEERPLRRVVRSVTRQGVPTIWEVAGNEPGLDLGQAAPTGWQRVRGAPEGVPVAPLRHPFVFRTTIDQAADVPADVRAETVPLEAGGTALHVTVMPRQPGLVASFSLPADLEPIRTNLPGVRAAGRWRATFVAPPPEGIALRATFAGTPPALADVAVVITSFRLPGGEGWQSLPAWLPQDRSVWSASAVHVVRPLAPQSPLR